MNSVNLVDIRLGALVCCDTVARDDYPVSSLLEGGGFMADSFVRPPVTVTVHLPCPVVIRSVGWTCRLGSQVTSFHEVMVTKDIMRTGTRCSPKCSVPGDGDCAKFVVCGRGMAEEGKILFSNRRVVQGNLGYRLGCSEDREALNMVTAVRVKIIRTEGASIPCMAGLEVFGESTGDRRFHHLEKKVLEHNSQSSVTQTSNVGFFGSPIVQSAPSPADDRSFTEDPSSSTSSSLETVPPEFLDPITQEMMVLPMTLPSGHNVDRSTLDKCADSFASWGGPPRDPFTGKLFSVKCGPVFNGGLKGRIDRFLISHGSVVGEGRSSGRTVGSATRIQQFLQGREGRGVKRILPQPDEDKKVKKKQPTDNKRDSGESFENILGDKVDVGDITNRSDEDTGNDLDKALFATLSRVKPITKF